ncbi:hypothetical protein Q4S45_13975 [Massilia sp. R2A-15]|uniref:hypothetical protein n=1 Tax=Massilia sp. R2A-15 TaxID=3064278 RepID=UPI00273405D3|nr:hypothetical protein [Massilia sp. R2A-15]WLI87845.1 hypothetical protein Q4S45_13975 [Massilia sp. R2A-15]
MNDKELIVDLLIRAVWGNIFPELWGKRTHTMGRAYVKNDFHNAFINKITGFLGELRYASVTRINPAICAGGWFLPVDPASEDPLENTCYYSVLGSGCSAVQTTYAGLKKALPDIPMFLLRPRLDLDLRSLDISSFVYFKFEGGQFNEVGHDVFFGQWKKKEPGRKPSRLPDIDAEESRDTIAFARKCLISADAIDTDLMRDLLLDRHIFDVELSGSYRKGRPTDLDFIKVKKDGKLKLVDVKYKFVSASNELGVNADHLPFFERMDQILGTETAYVVSLRRKSVEWSHLGWYYVPMSEFYGAESSKGNVGMNGESAIATNMRPLSTFSHWSGYRWDDEKI